MTDITIAAGPILACFPFAIMDCIVYNRPIYIGEDGMISVFSTVYHKKVASTQFADRHDFMAMNSGAVKRVEELVRNGSVFASSDLFDEVDGLARQYIRLNGRWIDAAHRRCVEYGEKCRAGKIPQP